VSVKPSAVYHIAQRNLVGLRTVLIGFELAVIDSGLVPFLIVDAESIDGGLYVLFVGFQSYIQ
jgi:hypothetical protein